MVKYLEWLIIVSDVVWFKFCNFLYVENLCIYILRNIVRKVNVLLDFFLLSWLLNFFFFECVGNFISEVKVIGMIVFVG